MPIDGGVTISDAARVLGISEQTVRRRVRRGELPAIRIERAQGYEYRIQLPLPHRPREAASQTDYLLDQVLTISRSGGDSQPDSHDEEPVLGVLVLEQARQISRLNDERAELYGRLGFLQSENLQLKNQLEGAHIKLQAAQVRILELEAPKGVPAEMSNHLQNVADSASQKLPSRPWWKFWR